MLSLSVGPAGGSRAPLQPLTQRSQPPRLPQGYAQAQQSAFGQQHLHPRWQQNRQQQQPGIKGNVVVPARRQVAAGENDILVLDISTENNNNELLDERRKSRSPTTMHGQHTALSVDQKFSSKRHSAISNKSNRSNKSRRSGKAGKSKRKSGVPGGTEEERRPLGSRSSSSSGRPTDSDDDDGELHSHPMLTLPDTESAYSPDSPAGSLAFGPIAMRTRLSESSRILPGGENPYGPAFSLGLMSDASMSSAARTAIAGGAGTGPLYGLGYGLGLGFGEREMVGGGRDTIVPGASADGRVRRRDRDLEPLPLTFARTVGSSDEEYEEYYGQEGYGYEYNRYGFSDKDPGAGSCEQAPPPDVTSGSVLDIRPDVPNATDTEDNDANIRPRRSMSLPLGALPPMEFRKRRRSSLLDTEINLKDVLEMEDQVVQIDSHQESSSIASSSRKAGTASGSSLSSETEHWLLGHGTRKKGKGKYGESGSAGARSENQVPESSTNCSSGAREAGTCLDASDEGNPFTSHKDVYNTTISSMTDPNSSASGLGTYADDDELSLVHNAAALGEGGAHSRSPVLVDFIEVYIDNQDATTLSRSPSPIRYARRRRSADEDGDPSGNGDEAAGEGENYYDSEESRSDVYDSDYMGRPVRRRRGRGKKRRSAEVRSHATNAAAAAAAAVTAVGGAQGEEKNAKEREEAFVKPGGGRGGWQMKRRFLQGDSGDGDEKSKVGKSESGSGRAQDAQDLTGSTSISSAFEREKEKESSRRTMGSLTFGLGKGKEKEKEREKEKDKDRGGERTEDASEDSMLLGGMGGLLKSYGIKKQAESTNQGLSIRSRFENLTKKSTPIAKAKDKDRRAKDRVGTRSDGLGTHRLDSKSRPFTPIRTYDNRTDLDPDIQIFPMIYGLRNQDPLNTASASLIPDMRSQLSYSANMPQSAPPNMSSDTSSKQKEAERKRKEKEKEQQDTTVPDWDMASTPNYHFHAHLYSSSIRKRFTQQQPDQSSVSTKSSKSSGATASFSTSLSGASQSLFGIKRTKAPADTVAAVVDDERQPSRSPRVGHGRSHSFSHSTTFSPLFEDPSKTPMQMNSPTDTAVPGSPFRSLSRVDFPVEAREDPNAGHRSPSPIRYARRSSFDDAAYFGDVADSPPKTNLARRRGGPGSILPPVVVSEVDESETDQRGRRLDRIGFGIGFGSGKPKSKKSDGQPPSSSGQSDVEKRVVSGSTEGSLGINLGISMPWGGKEKEKEREAERALAKERYREKQREKERKEREKEKKNQKKVSTKFNEADVESIGDVVDIS